MTSTQNATTDSDYLRVIWTLLLAYGGAVEDEAGDQPLHRWGGALLADRAATASVWAKLASGAEIDPTACTDPAERHGWCSQDTDTTMTVRWLDGTLALDDGTRLRWATVLPPDVGFAGLVKLLAGHGLNTGRAVANLRRRLNEYGEDEAGMFGYTCEIRP